MIDYLKALLLALYKRKEKAGLTRHIAEFLPVILFFFLAVASLAGAIAQQITGPVLSGQVMDGAGLALRATVILHSDSGADSRLDSDDQGHFTFSGLRSGTYTLTVSSVGFAPETRTVVVDSKALDLELQLKPQGTTSTISVTATENNPTASRLPVPNLDLPVTVNAVPQWALEEQNVNDLNSALRNVSGVNATRNYGVYDYYTIRGFNSSNLILVDGMRLEGNVIHTQLDNVERIEVLKGPSSILYGGSSTDGVINIIRKKPTLMRTYDLEYRGGRFNTQQVQAAATGPVFGYDHLLYRADASYQYADGWRDRGAKQFSLFPSLTWLLGDRTQISIFEGLTHDRYKTDAGIPVGVIGAYPNFDLSRNFDTSQDFQKTFDLQTQVLVTTRLSDHIQLRDSLFIRRLNDQYYTAESLSYVPTQNEVARTFLYFYHHELPLQNQADSVFQWRLLRIQHALLAGYEYENYYDYTDRCATCSVAIPPINLSSFIDTYQPISSFPISERDHFANVIHAGYWQDLASVGEHLKINVGGRYDNYGRHAHNDPWANGAPTNRPPDTILHQNAYTYRAGLLYGLPKNNQIFFNASTSFTPVTSVPASGPPLVPQTGQSYEVGHRLQLSSGRLTFNTAFYRLTYQHVVIALPNALYDQAGQQSSRGIEEDISGDLGHGMRAIVNYAYSIPRYDTYFTSNGTVNLSGNMPTFTYHHEANFWLTKLWSSGWTASIGGRYLSRMFADTANQYPISGYSIFNGRVGYIRGRWQWDLNAENLFDRRKYFVSAIYNTQVYPGAPINVFTTLRYRWR